jgi:hypothetical protein
LHRDRRRSRAGRQAAAGSAHPDKVACTQLTRNEANARTTKPPPERRGSPGAPTRAPLTSASPCTRVRPCGLPRATSGRAPSLACSGRRRGLPERLARDAG